MKSIYSVAASTALMVFALSVGQAAPKPNEASPAAQARISLQQVDVWTASIADRADHLELNANMDFRNQIGDLNTIKADVNKIGRELRSLDAQRASLAEWQTGVLDQVMPVMSQIAADVETSILLFNSNENSLWATSYRDEMAKISTNAEKVNQLLNGYLKLASVRQQEQRLEGKVGEVSGTR